MPSLGADMTEGTVTRWLVKPGERVARGDIVVEVETDKADMEVEIFHTGIISRLLVNEGERVPVGTPLALVEAEAGATPVMAPPTRPVAEVARVAEITPPPVPTKMEAPSRATPTARLVARELAIDLASIRGTGVDGCVTRADVEHAARQRAPAPAAAPPPRRRLLVSPRAQRLAREHAIDLSLLAGTGPAGSITGADIKKAIRELPPTPAPVAEAVPMPAPARAKGPQRGPIAALMARSNREIPHYFLGVDIDMKRALDWLATQNSSRPVAERMLYSALLLKASALAVHDVPEVNGYWTEDEFRPSAEVNLGVAISLRPGGLVAPAILDAATKPVDVVMRELRDLVQRARAGRLRASEMSSGTITVTNLGEQGVDYVYGVIYPPQVALVGFGRITERPWASGGMVGARPIISASLAGDHRASDGHRGGRFLAAIERLLQEPEHL